MDEFKKADSADKTAMGAELVTDVATAIVGTKGIGAGAKGAEAASETASAVSNAAKTGMKAIEAGEYTTTQTVANNLATRPYINSPSTITNIMKSGKVSLMLSLKAG